MTTLKTAQGCLSAAARRILCDWGDKSCSQDFRDQSDMERHKKDVHDGNHPKCPWASICCNYTNPRNDRMRKHIEAAHFRGHKAVTKPFRKKVFQRRKDKFGRYLGDVGSPKSPNQEEEIPKSFQASSSATLNNAASTQSYRSKLANHTCLSIIPSASVTASAPSPKKSNPHTIQQAYTVNSYPLSAPQSIEMYPHSNSTPPKTASSHHFQNYPMQEELGASRFIAEMGFVISNSAYITGLRPLGDMSLTEIASSSGNTGTYSKPLATNLYSPLITSTNSIAYSMNGVSHDSSYGSNSPDVHDGLNTSIYHSNQHLTTTYFPANDDITTPVSLHSV